MSFSKKKTGEEKMIFKGDCSICRRTKTGKVSDNTSESEGLGSFSRNLGIGAAKAAKK